MPRAALSPAAADSERPVEPSPNETEESWLGQALRYLSVIAVCLALATYLYKLWEECRLPALSADSLIYHLAIPAQWLQRGFLCEVDLPFHDGAAEHSPLFMETVIYGLMRLTGDDTLAFFIQPTCFLLIVALLHQSVRLLGLPVSYTPLTLPTS